MNLEEKKTKIDELHRRGINRADAVILVTALPSDNGDDDLEALEYLDTVYSKKSRPTTDGIPIRFNKTDMGNAERLVSLFGDRLRYCYRRKQWLVWTGKYWKWNDGGGVKGFAKQTVRAILDEAAREEDDDERKSLTKWALTSESHTRLEAMVAETQDLVEIEIDELDKNQWLLNCQNGTVDLKTGDLHPPSREEYITHILPVDYDYTASRDMWDAFIQRITRGNPELVHYLQKCIGYSLTGNTGEQCLFFAYGSGMNGKSTFLNTFRQILGPLAMQASTETFMTTYRPQAQSHTEDIANLHGKRLVLATEIEDGRRLAVTKIKQMTGGERVRASHKHEKEFEFDVTYKIWLSGNVKPDITDTTYSIWRRVKLIPFTEIISKDEEIKDYYLTLAHQEGPAILAWAVRGCLDWQRDGLIEPKEVSTATNEYRQEQDILAEFLEDRFVLIPNNSMLSITKSETWQMYNEWCVDSGVAPIKQGHFRKQLLAKGLREERSNGRRIWRGMRPYTNDELAAIQKGEVPQVPAGTLFSSYSLTRENKEKDSENQATSGTGDTAAPCGTEPEIEI